MPSFSCPHCGLVVVDIPVSFSGKRMKCRKCGEVFELPTFEGFAEPLAAEVAGPASPLGLNAVAAAPSYSYSSTPGMAIQQHQSNKTAVVAFALGILSILLCWVPLVGIVFCLVALVLSIVGFVGAKQGRGGTAFSVIGGVLATLGLVVSVLLIPVLFTSLGAVVDAVRVNATQQRMVEVQDALQAYLLKNGRYPDRLEDLPARRVEDGDASAGLRVDAWNNRFEYERLNDSERGYRLWSKGPDGVSGTEDDIHPKETEDRSLREIPNGRRRG